MCLWSVAVVLCDYGWVDFYLVVDVFVNGQLLGFMSQGFIYRVWALMFTNLTVVQSNPCTENPWVCFKLVTWVVIIALFFLKTGIEVIWLCVSRIPCSQQFLYSSTFICTLISLHVSVIRMLLENSYYFLRNSSISAFLLIAPVNELHSTSY